MLRFTPPSGSLRLAISGFASGSVAPLGSFGSKLALNAAELPKIDEEFEEITEGEELTKMEVRAAWDAARPTERSAARRVQESRGADCINRKTKWAALEAQVSDPKRVAVIAANLAEAVNTVLAQAELLCADWA